MIDVGIGKVGLPESTLMFEFESFADASRFCDIVSEHYKEEAKMLYMAIDRDCVFDEMEEVYKDEERSVGEIDAEVFGEILKLQV